LFDDVKEKNDKLSKDFEKLRKERKEDASIRTRMANEIKKIETENVKMKWELASKSATLDFTCTISVSTVITLAVSVFNLKKEKRMLASEQVWQMK
jgi:hypothetical protein